MSFDRKRDRRFVPDRSVTRSVSVVTPVYNAVAFVDRCVENVTAQGAVVREHIIVDGGSTDGTVERLVALAAANPKIRLILGPDNGQSDALNKGSEAARGRFLSLLNIDDHYQAGALSRMAELLDREREPTLLVGDCRVVDQNDRTLFWNTPSDLRMESLLLRFSRAQHPVNPSAYLYHREVHAIVGGYDIDEHYAMDLDFVLKCCARLNTRYVNEHWGNFRLAPGTKTFEDKSGQTRALALRRRHFAGLPPSAKFRAAVLQTKKIVPRILRPILRQSGSRPRLRSFAAKGIQGR